MILDYHLTTENLKGNSRSLKNVDRPYKDTSQVLVVGRVCDGRVRLERLPHTSKISARAYIQGKHKRKSLRTSNVRDAKRLATEWWEELRVADRRGEHIHAARFAEIAQRYLARRKKDLDAKTLSSGQYRNLVQKDTLLRPFIGHRQVTTIDEDFLMDVRAKRETATNKLGDPITQSTIKKDFIFIHSVLMFARDTLKLISVVPKSPSFRGEKAVVRHGRPFLTFDEYKHLPTIAREGYQEAELNVRTQRQRLSLYRYIVICVGGALRVDEAESVRWCDCEETTVTTPQGNTEDAVLMYVLGKHSRGGQREPAYVMFGGVPVYQKMKADRPEGTAETALLFPESHREGMKLLLKKAGLYEFHDPKSGRMRTRDRKSLRPTAITMRLDRGDNISYRSIAQWARTSPTMVEHFYDQLHPASAAGQVATFRPTT